MSEKTKDPFAHLPRRNLFADGTAVPSGKPISAASLDWIPPLPDIEVQRLSYRDGEVIAENIPIEDVYRRIVVLPSDCSDLKVGDPVAPIIPATAPAESAQRGRGRPKAEAGYPGSDCGLSRAQWYRRQREDRAKAKHEGES